MMVPDALEYIATRFESQKTIGILNLGVGEVPEGEVEIKFCQT
jgi:hypothetical protein